MKTGKTQWVWWLGLLAVVGAVAGCRSPRPASMADWEACLIDQQVLGPAGADSPASFESGEGQVLWVRAEWDRSMFVSEYSFGELLLALPASVAAGDAVEAGANSMYQEGGQLLVYRSSTLTGTITVEAANEDGMTLKLALTATAPTVDVSQRGEVPVTGTIKARRVKSAGECR